MHSAARAARGSFTGAGRSLRGWGASKPLFLTWCGHVSHFLLLFCPHPRCRRWRGVSRVPPGAGRLLPHHGLGSGAAQQEARPGRRGGLPGGCQPALPAHRPSVRVCVRQGELAVCVCVCVCAHPGSPTAPLPPQPATTCVLLQVEWVGRAGVGWGVTPGGCGVRARHYCFAEMLSWFLGPGSLCRVSLPPSPPPPLPSTPGSAPAPQPPQPARHVGWGPCGRDLWGRRGCVRPHCPWPLHLPAPGRYGACPQR